MVWEEWLAIEMKRVAERLVAAYNPLYAIANSIETHLLVPELARLGVPSVALVHEFAAYTRPLAKMRDVLDWATHVVFPAHCVAQSSYTTFPGFARRRGVHVFSQGRAEPRVAQYRYACEPSDFNVRHRQVVRPTMQPALLSFLRVFRACPQGRSTCSWRQRPAPGVPRPNLRFRFVG